MYITMVQVQNHINKHWHRHKYIDVNISIMSIFMYVSIQQSFVSSLWGSSGGVLGDELSENGEGPSNL